MPQWAAQRGYRRSFGYRTCNYCGEGLPQFAKKGSIYVCEFCLKNPKVQTQIAGGPQEVPADPSLRLVNVSRSDGFVERVLGRFERWKKRVKLVSMSDAEEIDGEGPFKMVTVVFLVKCPFAQEWPRLSLVVGWMNLELPNTYLCESCGRLHEISGFRAFS